MTLEERIAELERKVEILSIALKYQQNTNNIFFGQLNKHNMAQYNRNAICFILDRAINKESKE